MRKISHPDGIEKVGYIDIKFTAKRKGKRAWNRRWIRMVKLCTEADGKACAKFDIYQDEDAFRKGKYSDRVQIILENVFAIRRVVSSTRDFAFTVEGDVLLSLAGRSETETQDWMRELRRIFMPRLRRKTGLCTDIFEVSIIDNESSSVASLNGDYYMSIQSSAIQLMETTKGQRSCRLDIKHIRRFGLAKLMQELDEGKVLRIEAGPFLNQGEAEYRFYSSRAREIVGRIKVLSEKQYSSYVSEQTHQSGTLEPKLRPHASTDPNTCTKYNRHNVPPYRQSSYPGGMPQEHSYNELARTFKSLERDSVSKINKWAKMPVDVEVVEEEDPYSHLNLSSCETSSDTGSDEDDGDSKPATYTIQESRGDCDKQVLEQVVYNPYLNGARDADSPPPIPSPRCTMRNVDDVNEGRTMSECSNSSKTSSRDSGFLSPSENGQCTFLESPEQKIAHHYSVDSVNSSMLLRPGSSEHSFHEEEEINQSNEDSVRKSFGNAESSISLEVGEKNSCGGVSRLGLTGLYSGRMPGEQDNIDDVRCLLRNIGESEDQENVYENLDTDGKIRIQVGQVEMDDVPYLVKNAGKSGNEENVYENVDERMKRKDLSKLLGSDFNGDKCQINTNELGAAVRPTTIALKKPVKQKRFMLKIPKVLRSPRPGKSGKAFFPGNEALKDVKKPEDFVGTCRPVSNDEGFAEASLLPNQIAASTPVGSRVAKDSPPHPNDLLVNSTAVPSAETSQDPDYDVPSNNMPVEPKILENTARIPKCEGIDPILVDDDHTIVGEPLSPFLPFGSGTDRMFSDPFNIAWIQSNPEEQATLSNLSPKAGIRRETNLQGDISPCEEVAAVPLRHLFDNTIGADTMLYGRETSVGSSTTDEDLYSFDNSSGYLSSLSRSDEHTFHQLSGTSESAGVRNGRLSYPLDIPNSETSQMDISTSFIDQLSLEDNSDYVVMSGQGLKSKRSGREGSYISMTNPFEMEGDS